MLLTFNKIKITYDLLVQEMHLKSLMLFWTEEAIRRYSSKMVFLKIS